MRTYLSALLSRLRTDEEGVTLVEYGVAVAFAVAAGAVFVSVLLPAFTTAIAGAAAAM